MVYEIIVPEGIRERAARAVQRMIELGPTAGAIRAGSATTSVPAAAAAG
jgi:hypothetical protein